MNVVEIAAALKSQWFMKNFTIYMATKANVIPLTRLLSCHMHLGIHKFYLK